MNENTPDEIAAVRRLVARQPDAAVLTAVLGLDENDNPTPLCKEHGKPKVRRGDGQGWRCRACDERHRTHRATPGRPKG